MSDKDIGEAGAAGLAAGPVEDYVRNAIVLRVVDGDTLELNIDLGFRVWYRTRVRLLGLDCPETTGPTRAAGAAAKKFTDDWVTAALRERASAGAPALVQLATTLDRSDSFGRVLAVITCAGRSLNAELLAAGHAAASP